MARREVTQLAQAIRGSAQLAVKRHARSHFEGIVIALTPLQIDLTGADAEPLTDEDVTFGRALTKHLATEPLKVGDALVLIETEGGDYIAVEHLPATGPGA